MAKGGASLTWGGSRLTDALALSPRAPASASRPTASECLSPRGGNFHLAEAERLCTTTSLHHASPRLTSPHQRSTSLHHVVGFTEAERVQAAMQRQVKQAEQIQNNLELRQVRI